MFVEEGIEAIRYFQTHYDIVQRIQLGEEKVFLGERESKICRFCGLSEPEVHFRNIAHAIPEFIGNKRLFSYYECDECNDKFSMSLEDHLANYIAPWRTLMTIRGKKGIPTLKNEQDGWRIEGSLGELRIAHREDNPIIQQDAANKSIAITGHRGRYIPRAVFKCLVKMAISIMPDDELSNFTHAIEWINNVDFDNDKANMSKLLAVFGFIPSPYQLPIINILFRRKPEYDNTVPYMQYVVMFYNLMFQIPMPLCEHDRTLDGKTITIIKFPLPFIEEYGEPKYDIIDFTSSEIVTNDSINISFNYSDTILKESTHFESEE